jgi:phosphatidylserine/phosphatidylglycerophosphate/cardiolipin synthase-like enzyme
MLRQEAPGEQWNSTGDMPVRRAPHVAFLVDGRMTMLKMCCAFLSAKHSIHITAWGLSPDLLLVRGKHKRAGDDGSEEQEELLAWLRAQGLSTEALNYWQSDEDLSVTNVLAYVVKRGIAVRILLWDTYTLPFQHSPGDVQKALEPLGISCLLDDSHMGLLNHPIEAHHQKTVIVDERVAFVGGIDMMSENNGDYDRWDTKGHPYATPLRTGKDGKVPHSWHDVHTLFDGPAVADVERNFRQRWNSVARLHQVDDLLDETSTVHPPQESPIRIQVVRTIPKGIYDFAPEEGIATILESYRRAFAAARRSIYIENQYFWRRTFLGMENPALGVPNADMEALLQALADALGRGVVVTIILPDQPNVGRNFTDEGLKYLWELKPAAVASGALQAYTLGSSILQVDRALYRPIYVHAKVAIVDDRWVTVGSANLNNRGMRDDSELNVAIQQPDIAQALRVVLMAEHLGLCSEETLFRIIEAAGQADFSSSEPQRRSIFMPSLRRWFRLGLGVSGEQLDTTVPTLYAKHMQGELGEQWALLQSQLGDPFKATALFAKQAKDNLLAIKERRPLHGHLVPYIPYERADEYGVSMHAVNGWLDTLPDTFAEQTG